MRSVLAGLVLWITMAIMGHSLIGLLWAQAILISGVVVGLLCLAIAAMLSSAMSHAEEELDEQYNHWDDPLDVHKEDLF